MLLPAFTPLHFEHSYCTFYFFLILKLYLLLCTIKDQAIEKYIKILFFDYIFHTINLKEWPWKLSFVYQFSTLI